MGEATAPGQCTEALYTIYGLGRDGIQGTLYAVARNGTPARALGSKLYPMASAILNRMGVAKSLVQHDFWVAKSFGGTIDSLPPSMFFFD